METDEMKQLICEEIYDDIYETLCSRNRSFGAGSIEGEDKYIDGQIKQHKHVRVWRYGAEKEADVELEWRCCKCLYPYPTLLAF